MASRFEDYTLTLSGSAQQVGAALGLGAFPIAQADLQPDGANANPVYVGGSAAVSASLHGVRLEAGISGVPQAPWRTNDFVAPLTLNDIWVIGTASEKLHFQVVPGRAI